MRFINGHQNGVTGNMVAGRKWTICTIDDNYLPDMNIDLYGSSSNDADMRFALWDSGDDVF